MPDAVPTERVPGGKPKKKLSKTAIIGIGAGALVLLYIVKKKKETEEGTEGNPYTSQAFIPVTGENVAGVGAGSSGNLSGESGTGGLLESQTKYQEFLTEFLGKDTEARERQESQEHEFLSKLIENTLAQTGGGPPGEGQNGSGGGSGGGGSGPTPVNPPSPPPPPSQPTKPPAPTPVQYKNITCGNGCPGHEYPHGKQGKGSKTVECMTKDSKGHCHW